MSKSFVDVNVVGVAPCMSNIANFGYSWMTSAMRLDIIHRLLACPDGPGIFQVPGTRYVPGGRSALPFRYPVSVRVNWSMYLPPSSNHQYLSENTTPATYLVVSSEMSVSITSVSGQRFGRGGVFGSGQ